MVVTIVAPDAALGILEDDGEVPVDAGAPNLVPASTAVPRPPVCLETLDLSTERPIGRSPRPVVSRPLLTNGEALGTRQPCHEYI